MNMKTLTATVEQKTTRKFTWELGKKYTAIDTETGEVVAIYNPKTGELKYYNI